MSNEPETYRYCKYYTYSYIILTRMLFFNRVKISPILKGNEVKKTVLMFFYTKPNGSYKIRDFRALSYSPGLSFINGQALSL